MRLLEINSSLQVKGGKVLAEHVAPTRSTTCTLACFRKKDILTKLEYRSTTGSLETLSLFLTNYFKKIRLTLVFFFFRWLMSSIMNLLLFLPSLCQFGVSHFLHNLVKTNRACYGSKIIIIIIITLFKCRMCLALLC